MKDHSDVREYLLLMRGTEWDGGLSPREIQDGLERMMAWVETLRERGVLTAGQPLVAEGQVVRSATGASVTDGPFVEAAE